MKIITAGYKYADIDILACGIAYKELLKLKGEEVEFVNPGVLNASIPSIIRDWRLDFKKKVT